MSVDRPPADVTAANALNGAVFLALGVAAGLLGLWGLGHAVQLALRPAWSEAARDLMLAIVFLGAGLKLGELGVRVFRTGRG